MGPLSTVGRKDELRTISEFLEPEPKAAATLLIEGVAGIGKTTLLRYAMATAGERGFTLLRSVASQADSTASLAVLADLLGETLDEVHDDLATPQARALEIALLRADPGDESPDRRAIATATLEAIRCAARRAPLLIAIDDLQWVDDSSAQALVFALRRLGDEPVLVAMTLRRGEKADPIGIRRVLPNVQRLEIGPMDARLLRRIVNARRESPLSLAGVQRLADATGGNPLFVLELSRATEDRELSVGEMPVPSTDIGGALRARLSGLPRPVRDLLLILAATSRPEKDLVNGTADGPSALATAEEEGIVEISGRQISFVHPLYASTVYAMATSRERRSAHGRLAEESADPEERARHLALAAEGPDEAVARMLDDAARVALARGAPDAAGELAELAIRLTPRTTSSVQQSARKVRQAEYRFQAGDTKHATALLSEVVASLPRGVERADALYRLALFSGNDVARARELLQRALADLAGGSSTALRARIHTELAWAGILGGDLHEAVAQSQRACEAARESGSQVALGLALTASAYGCFLAGLPAGEALAEAQHATSELAGMDRLILPRTARGALSLWAGDLDSARIDLEHDHREMTAHGQLSMLWEVLVYLAELEVRAGYWEAAGSYAAEGLDSLEDAGLEEAFEVHLWSSALVAAHRGEVERARLHATRGLELAESHDDVFHIVTNRSVLGFLELSLGNPKDAAQHLEPLEELTSAMGLEEPGAFPYVPDQIEALVLLGELDHAKRILGKFERQAQTLGRSWALATAARCHGLLLAAEGDLGAAVAAFDDALRRHANVPQPFDLARTLLIQGRALRRLKRKAPARAALERAVSLFNDLGAPLWVSQTEAELGRIGGRASSRDELTPTERQVAAMVAEGKTNREVAAALFMSVHTVSANLKRVYRKLDLRSRTELAARLRRETSAGGPDG